MNINTGINENKVNQLMLDIYEYEEKINLLLEKISNLMESTTNIYSGFTSDDLRKKYNDFSVNYTNIKNNIHDYSEDLFKIKNNYLERDQQNTNHILKPLIIDETIKTGTVNYEHK